MPDTTTDEQIWVIVNLDKTEAPLIKVVGRETATFLARFLADHTVCEHYAYLDGMFPDSSELFGDAE